jgi:methylmalonyl-CoA epimerase
MNLPAEFASFEFDHMGIAVRSLDEGFVFYKNLGFQWMAVEEVASEKVRVGLLELRNHCRLELLEPTSPDSPVQKFLNARGPGIHHVCLRVPDIGVTLKELKEKGMQLINEQPKLGAHQCLVAFVHPRSTGGVLIELSQKVRA